MRNLLRWWRPFLWVLLSLLLVPLLLSSPLFVAQSNSGSRYFSQTGQTVQGAFLTFFDRYGGTNTFGVPISSEMTENGVTVQYFQRARFEWHPHNSEGQRVQLGLLGAEMHGTAEAPVSPLPATSVRTVRYFSETGHNVTNIFLSFWEKNGQVRLFGYPLGEAYSENGIIYQWFQRARFEYRQGQVTLGMLGQEWQDNRTPAREPIVSTPNNNTRHRQVVQTGQTLQGSFLDYWEKNGAEQRFGYPISGEFVEDGRTVQYFEYARLEWYPNNPPRRQVLLGNIGTELHGPAYPPSPQFARHGNINYRYFPDTGHTVSNAFLRYFDEHGGLPIFGNPLGETFREHDEIVQWFERRKLVYRSGVVYEEPLGRLRFNPGVEGNFPAQHVFHLFLGTHEETANSLGAGIEDAKYPKLTHQMFEGGQLFWRHDSNQVYVLYNTGAWQIYENPWQAGEPETRGLSTPTGRYEPVKALGSIWHLIGGPRSPLGWATSPANEGEGVAQAFKHGSLLYNPINDRIYVFQNYYNWYDLENEWSHIEVWE